MSIYDVDFVEVDVDNQEALNAFRAKMFPHCINLAAAENYLNDLVRHIHCVRQAGDSLRVLPRLLRQHDQSKFSLIEFPAAVERFRGGDPNPDRYAAGWLHHIHSNPHHWQHWMFPDGFTPRGSSVEGGVMEMPREYVLEMVADWMGSSMTYTGSWDMTKWLTENMVRIRLHSRTAQAVRKLLRELGYPDEVVMLPWAQEKNRGRRVRDMAERLKWRKAA